MNLKKIIKDNLSQIYALTERHTKLKMRFKYTVIVSFITPIFTILMPIIVISAFFEVKDSLGHWTKETYFVYLFIAYNISLIQRIIRDLPNQLRLEKFWKTLPALIIGPFNRFNLLFGIFFSEIILIAIPFTIFFILCYIMYPISFLTILFVLGVFFLIALIFCGIGLMMGIFAISKENFWKTFHFVISLVIWLSCLTYPYEMFPESLQRIIDLNPLYYIIDFLRFLWIENNVIISITSHPVHLLILIIVSFLVPSIGVYVFNYIYKKYGVVGY
ncbi:MAG: ABC transporter permease [Promethearchaeota archaeon]